MTKQAVILAAGRGMRLGGEVNGDPKCLIPFGDKVLIEHQMAALQSVGIERFFVLVGHEADRVRSLVGGRAVCIENSRYAETNSLYSLWMAREQVKGSFMLVNGDVVAHPDIYRRVLAAPGTALAYDSSSGNEPEHMKVDIVDGRLRTIGKTLAADVIDGENVGILRFDDQAAALLFSEADSIIKEGEFKCWAPAAVGRIADRTSIYCADIADLPWTEIDFPEDLAYARETIWPSIVRNAPTGCGHNTGGTTLPYRAPNEVPSATVTRRAQVG